MTLPYRWRQLTLQWLFDISGPLHITGTAVLLPFIQVEFQLSKNAAAWPLVIYFLSAACFMLAGASFGNVLGRRRVAMIGLAIDTAMQFGAFLSPSFGILLACRFVGGFGNALAVPNMAPLAVTAFPVERRGQVLGLMSLGLGIGFLLSSLVAGSIADTFGWRYLYLLTAVLYGVLLAGMLFMGKQEQLSNNVRAAFRGFDYPGLALLGGMLVALSLSMQQLGASLGSPSGLALLGVAAACGVAFIAVERRSAQPLISLRLFRQHDFTSAMGRLFAFSMVRAGNNFLLPFYCIQGLGWTGAFTGTVLIAMNIGQPLIAPVSGQLADRVGAGRVVVAALAVLAIGLLLLATLGEAPPVAQVVASLAVLGLGIGLFTPPNAKILYGAVPAEQMSLAPGVQVLTSSASNAIGAALAAMLAGLFAASTVQAAFQRTVVIMLVAFIVGVAMIEIVLRMRGRKAEQQERGARES